MKNLALILVLIFSSHLAIASESLPRAGRVGVGLGENQKGEVFVRRVLEGSAAAEAGLIEGDILTAIGGEKIVTRDQAMAKMSRLIAHENMP